jgi:cysteinyl-tRNA synthetase
MVHELGVAAESGTRDPATVLGPFVDLALALRSEARTDGRYADADAVRDRLLALGVEVHDTPDGVTWELS